jgi:hypothetical protein
VLPNRVMNVAPSRKLASYEWICRDVWFVYCGAVLNGTKKALTIARQRLKFVDDGWRVSATHLRTF